MSDVGSASGDDRLIGVVLIPKSGDKGTRATGGPCGGPGTSPTGGSEIRSAPVRLRDSSWYNHPRAAPHRGTSMGGR